MYTDDFLKDKKRVEKISKALAQHRKVFEKLDDLSGDGFGKILEDMRYCILKMHYLAEIFIDDIIIKRYVGDHYLAGFIKSDILAQLDFYKKIRILENVNAYCKSSIDTKLLNSINKIRNAVAHNYPIRHKDYTYKKGHIIYNLKIVDLMDDAMDLIIALKKLNIPIIPDYSVSFSKWLAEQKVKQP
jgi:hypothetical protein